MSTTRKHFVTFISPGTLYAEQTSQEIQAWDPVEAATRAKTITERHNAKPYGFRFETRLVHDPLPDGEGGTLKVESKMVESSGVYHLTGKVCDVRDFDPEKDAILIGNMNGNDMHLVVVNENSYRSTTPFNVIDLLVSEDGKILQRGDDPQFVAYRAKRRAEVEAEMAAIIEHRRSRETP